MTTTHDIIGADNCQGRKKAQDIVDAQVWGILESRHPGLLADVHTLKGPGEKLHIPHTLESKRDRAKRLDDGVMSVRELAALAGCCYETARQARKKKGRE
ncbi:MAG: hypothetical protein V3573_14570 [Desulfovibrionaceae bacterium]